MDNKESNINLDLFDYKREEKSKEDKINAIEKRNKNKKINKLINSVAAILISALLITAAGFIYFELSPVRNPQRTAEAYIKAVQNENWGKAYKYSKISSDSLFTKKAFTEFCNLNPQALKITNSEILDYNIELDEIKGDMFSYSVDYVNGDGKIDCFYVNVKKVKDGLAKFDKYKVVPKSNEFLNYTIFAPAKTVVAVNGIEIEPLGIIEEINPATYEKYSYAKYVADFIPVGEYELTAKNEMLEPVSQKISVKENDSENVIYLEMKLNENAYIELTKSAENVIDTVYNGIINNDLKLESLPFSKDFTEEKLKNLMNDISDEIYTDNKNYSVTAFQKTKAEIISENDDASVNCISENKITVSFKFNYNYEYTYDKENLKDNRVDEGYFSVLYILENGEWKIDDILEQAWF